MGFVLTAVVLGGYALVGGTCPDLGSGWLVGHVHARLL